MERERHCRATKSAVRPSQSQTMYMLWTYHGSTVFAIDGYVYNRSTHQYWPVTHSPISVMSTWHRKQLLTLSSGTTDESLFLQKSAGWHSNSIFNGSRHDYLKTYKWPLLASIDSWMPDTVLPCEKSPAPLLLINVIIASSHPMFANSLCQLAYFTTS